MSFIKDGVVLCQKYISQNPLRVCAGINVHSLETAETELIPAKCLLIMTKSGLCSCLVASCIKETFYFLSNFNC